MTDVAALIQARMSSSRLPGKVLINIGGEPMLQHVVSRTRRAKTIDQVLVVTSTDPTDDPIERWCQSEGIGVFRGSLHDVLGRYADATRKLEPSVVVRVTADCPLLDPAVIDEVVAALRSAPDAMYAASRLPDHRTFPLGIDVEAVRSEALLDAASRASEPYQREHVTPWFYDGSIESSPIHVTTTPPAVGHRWTVDTQEDLAFMRTLITKLPPNAPWREVLRVVEQDSELQAINAHVTQKTYREVST